MKISIITPTNNTKYLNELKDCILSQTHKEWEWVLLLNQNPNLHTELDDSYNNAQIKVHYTSSDSNVGKLKKEACALASGDIIVEIDHDDLITKDCLEKIYKAFKENPNVGFVYSDNAKLADKFIPYNPEHGWKFRKFEYGGKQYFAMNSLPLTPGNISFIWFCPDHVRAWRTSLYDKVGGHDETLDICDDHDLMCRMYLETDFYHIPEVLYLYRIHGENTWLNRSKRIQEKTQEIHEKYIYRLSETWAKRNGHLMIDLCGGHNPPNGYISIDMKNSHILADLERGIPMGDESVGVIRAHDALEHIENQQLLMSEIYRILKPGGILLSMTPSTDGRGAWQDPTHKSFWNENSFWYWTRPEQMKYIDNTDVKFRKLSLYTGFPNDWCKEHNISYVFARLDKIKT